MHINLLQKHKCVKYGYWKNKEWGINLSRESMINTWLISYNLLRILRALHRGPRVQKGGGTRVRNLHVDDDCDDMHFLTLPTIHMIQINQTYLQ